MKKFLLFVGLAIYVVASFLLADWLQTYYGTPGLQTSPVTTVTQPTRTYTQDVHLAAVLQSLGVSDKEIDLAYGDSPRWEGEWASYINRSILIKEGLTPDQEREMLGHEYMHHVWETKLTYPEQTALVPELNQLKSHPLILDRLAGPAYANCNNACRLPEVPAYACTILPRESLLPQLQTYCNKYLPTVQ